MADERFGFWNAEKQLVSSDGTLVCPICHKEYKNNHILQCPVGHLFCEDCDCDRRGRCVTCNRPIVRQIRNRQLEHISSNTDILSVTEVTTEISTDGVPDGSTARGIEAYARGPRCDYCGISDLQVWYKCIECGNTGISCEECLDGTEEDRPWEGVRCGRHPLVRITSQAQAQLATTVGSEYRAIALAIKNQKRITKARRPPRIRRI